MSPIIRFGLIPLAALLILTAATRAQTPDRGQALFTETIKSVREEWERYVTVLPFLQVDTEVVSYDQRNNNRLMRQARYVWKVKGTDYSLNAMYVIHDETSKSNDRTRCFVGCVNPRYHFVLTSAENGAPWIVKDYSLLGLNSGTGKGKSVYQPDSTLRSARHTEHFKASGGQLLADHFSDKAFTLVKAVRSGENPGWIVVEGTKAAPALL
jgi:hypothetical protein